MTTEECEANISGVAGVVSSLQRLAAAFSASLTAVEFGITLQVVYLAGAPCGWRMVETERADSHRKRIRMHCFESQQQIEAAINGHVAWDVADEEFRARHLATAGGFPGVTGDWVHSKDFDLVFGSSRHAIRLELCATEPCRTALLR